MLWRIEAGHFVAGLVARRGVVVQAAPILGWSVGRSWREVKVWMRRRGWHGSPVCRW
jgi:hypothetical protein